MTQALAALEWAVGAALIALGALTCAHWLRHRDRSRGFLALAVGSLGLLALLGRFSFAPGTPTVAVSAVSIGLFMTSGYGFVLFRHSLLPIGRRLLWECTALVVVITSACIVVNVVTPTTQPGGVPLAIDIAMLLTWCVIVAGSIRRLWKVSHRLPHVQRARLRSLNAGFTGLIIAILGTVVATVATTSTDVQLAIEAVVLLSVPWLAVSLTPPRWLRRVWREREEVQLRGAINNLLLYSPDEPTLAERAIEWAARLLGGGGALIGLEGRVLAATGISVDAAEQLLRQVTERHDQRRVSFSSAHGAVAVVPFQSDDRDGALVVLAGPFTPLFGDEELDRLAQYAVSITVALDRVHLTVGMRRNAELLDLAYDAVFTWDFATRGIQYWNRAASELYGFAADEAIGRDPQPLLQSVYPIPLAQIVTELTEHGHWEGELVQTTKEGRILPISARWALQRDDSGKPVSVLEINRDISGQARAAAELRAARDVAEQASNAKSEYLSRMSHELRTPLAAMLGFSDLLEMREPREDQRQAIDAIQRAGSHLLSLVNDVLDIARIEAGRESLSVRPVDVREILEECVGLVAQSANERQVTLSTRQDGDERLHVRADRQRLVQVLLNLLSNAIKYGMEGGHVVAAASARDGQVEISVSDDGPGLSDDEQERLFQPFERLGAERTHIPGTGLGLALARQLTLAMGGTLTVESTPGEGATFSLRLERAREGDGESIVRALAPAVLRDPATERVVLYVEDNLATVALVESILALRPNVRLITAMQGGLALELAREHRPDLIVLDLHLPDLDGDEVMHSLRADHRTARIPVVMYSADATAPQIARLLAAGATDYLTKPARVSDFLEMIDRILGQRSEERRGA